MLKALRGRRKTQKDGQTKLKKGGRNARYCGLRHGRTGIGVMGYASRGELEKELLIVVPRQHQFNEHVNDHQVEFARNVAQRMGTIIPVEDIETLGDIITNYDQIVAGMGHGMSSNNAKFNDELEKLVNELY